MLPKRAFVAPTVTYVFFGHSTQLNCCVLRCHQASRRAGISDPAWQLIDIRLCEEQSPDQVAGTGGLTSHEGILSTSPPTASRSASCIGGFATGVCAGSSGAVEPVAEKNRGELEIADIERRIYARPRKAVGCERPLEVFLEETQPRVSIWDCIGPSSRGGGRRSCKTSLKFSSRHRSRSVQMILKKWELAQSAPACDLPSVFPI